MRGQPKSEKHAPWVTATPSDLLAPEIKYLSDFGKACALPYVLKDRGTEWAKSLVGFGAASVTS